MDRAAPTAVVTTGNDRDPTAEARARELVGALNAHHGVRAVWASRYHTASRPLTLVRMLEEHTAAAVLVVDGAGVHLRLRDGAEFRLHGGLGVLRLRNVLGGGSDNLASVCALREGDVFVDGTAGQLQDAIVAAAAIGPTGKVIAFEASPLLWAVTSGRPVCTGDADVDRMLNERIEVRLGEVSASLRELGDGSADVVYFDPMFQKPRKASASFDVLRGLAHSGRLPTEAIAEARRVARRCVVVMDQAGGAELEAIAGMRIVHAGQRKRYGVLDCSTRASARADEARTVLPAPSSEDLVDARAPSEHAT